MHRIVFCDLAQYGQLHGIKYWQILTSNIKQVYQFIDKIEGAFCECDLSRKTLIPARVLVNVNAILSLEKKAKRTLVYVTAIKYSFCLQMS